MASQSVGMQTSFTSCHHHITNASSLSMAVVEDITLHRSHAEILTLSALTRRRQERCLPPMLQIQRPYPMRVRTAVPVFRRTLSVAVALHQAVVAQLAGGRCSAEVTGTSA